MDSKVCVWVLPLPVRSLVYREATACICLNVLWLNYMIVYSSRHHFVARKRSGTTTATDLNKHTSEWFIKSSSAVCGIDFRQYIRLKKVFSSHLCQMYLPSRVSTSDDTVFGRCTQPLIRKHAVGNISRRMYSCHSRNCKALVWKWTCRGARVRSPVICFQVHLCISIICCCTSPQQHVSVNTYDDCNTNWLCHGGSVLPYTQLRCRIIECERITANR